MLFETVVRELQFRKHMLLQASMVLKAFALKMIRIETSVPKPSAHLNGSTEQASPSRKGVSVGSFHRNMELLRFGEPVCARAPPEDFVWLFQLFSVESL